MLDPMRRRLAGLAARRPSLALALTGPAGVGKSHALASLLRGLPCAHLTLQGRGALEGFIQTLPAASREAAWIAGGSTSPSQSRSGAEAAAARLSALAPYVLVVEDLHLAEPSALDWWADLARLLRRGRGVGLLVSSRGKLPERLGSPVFEELSLSNLTPAECSGLVRTQLGTDPPAALIGWLHARTAGNPLFILEFLRQLSREGSLWNDGAAWQWREPRRHTLPETVEALIWEQLQAVRNPAGRTALEACAYLETRLPECAHQPEFLARLVGAPLGAEADPQNGSPFRSLEQAGLMREGQFVSPVYREVMFAQLGRERLKRLSRALLEDDSITDPGTEQLLGALQRARCLEDAGWPAERQRAALLLAGQEARRTGNLALEARWVAAAARLPAGPNHGEGRGELALRAAQCLTNLSDLQTFEEMAELAARTLPDPGEPLLLLAGRYAREGQQQQLERVLARLPESARTPERWPALEIKLLFDSARYGLLLERWRARPEWAASCTSATAYCVAYALLDGGDLEAARQLAENLLARLAADDPGRAEMYDILGTVAFYQGDYAGARRLLAQVVEGYRRSGSPSGLPNALRNHAVVQLQAASYREAMAGFQEACEIYAAQGAYVGLAQTQVMVCDAHLELGEYEQTDALLRAALSVLEHAPPQAFLVYALTKKVRLCLVWRPPHGAVLALRAARQALDVATELRNPVLVVDAQIALSRAQTFSAYPDEGLTRAEEAYGGAARLGYPEAQVSALESQAVALEVLGRPEAAFSAYQQARDLARSLSLVLETQQLGLQLARLHGDAPEVAVRLAWFQEAGFVRSAAEARQVLVGLGALDCEVDARSGSKLVSRSHAPEPSGRAQESLTLDVLGPVQVRGPEGVTPVQGALRRGLLLLLLEARIAGLTGVGRLHLIDRLYRGQEEGPALTSLKAAVFKARQAHGGGLIQTTPDGYALGAGASDAEQFPAGGPTRLWRGPYGGSALTGPESGGGEVAESLHLALFGRAERLLLSEPAEAARLGALLCAADPYDLEALRLRCRALEGSGQSRTLKRLYGQAQDLFAEIGEALPGHWSGLLTPN